MEKEFFCILHTSIGCDHRRSYDRRCDLEVDHKFVKVSCSYRWEAATLPDEPVASPVAPPVMVADGLEEKLPF